jgi:ABC-2 type transport system permease protein
MIAIFKREFKSYFINVSGYVFLAAIWLFSGIFATALNFIGQYASYEYALSNLMIVLLLIIPILTMRSMSEDRRAKTDMLLYSLPVSSAEVILGKYFAMIAVWGIACLGMGATPIILGMYGAVNFASAYGALLGFFLLGAALIAVCTFVSSLTESQLSAAISTIGVIVFMVIVGLVNGIGSEEEGNRLISNYAVRFVLDWISVLSRFSNFGYGLLEFSSLIYYVSLAAIFLFLTVRVYQKRRWE